MGSNRNFWELSLEIDSEIHSNQDNGVPFEPQHPTYMQTLGRDTRHMPPTTQNKQFPQFPNFFMPMPFFGHDLPGITGETYCFRKKYALAGELIRRDRGKRDA
ncbi:hypothetical protein CSC82_15400 [Rhodobacteraceae bacterium 4F10]|nr:hypothetical protein CSC82_15400 [Rhodobacteraceae bacterium 4F10]